MWLLKMTKEQEKSENLVCIGHGFSSESDSLVVSSDFVYMRLRVLSYCTGCDASSRFNLVRENSMSD